MQIHSNGPREKRTYGSTLTVPEKLVDALVGRLTAVVAAAVDEVRGSDSVHHAIGILHTRKQQKKRSANAPHSKNAATTPSVHRSEKTETQQLKEQTKTKQTQNATVQRTTSRSVQT